MRLLVDPSVERRRLLVPFWRSAFEKSGFVKIFTNSFLWMDKLDNKVNTKLESAKRITRKSKAQMDKDADFLAEEYEADLRRIWGKTACKIL